MVANPEVTQKIQRLRVRSFKSTSIFAHLPVAENGGFAERGPELRAQGGLSAEAWVCYRMRCVRELQQIWIGPAMPADVQ
jgi:hypothetical protein